MLQSFDVIKRRTFNLVTKCHSCVFKQICLTQKEILLNYFSMMSDRVGLTQLLSLN
jgi:hypothetical protein